MSDVELHVGYDPASLKARVLDAVARAEAGDLRSENHVTFESWDGLAKVLTGKRLELLRSLHAQAAASIADLARRLERDYKRVHEDVEILSTAGLIEPVKGGGLQATFDEIRTAINLGQSAA
jgi:predicted transcriptional regulator